MYTDYKTYLVTYLEGGKTKTCKVTGRDASAAVGVMNCNHPCATTLSIEPLSTNNKKEEKKVDLTKKMTISLTEDDVKEMVAGYIRRNTSMTTVKAENVELVYGVKYSGPQMDRVEHGYLKECIVKA